MILAILNILVAQIYPIRIWFNSIYAFGEMFEDFQDNKKQRNNYITKMQNNQSNKNMKFKFPGTQEANEQEYKKRKKNDKTPRITATITHEER